MDDKPPGRRNWLATLTRPECEYFREHCNFTPDELAVFNLRVRDWSTVHIAMDLNIGQRTVTRRLDNIHQKIMKIQ